MNHTQRGSTSYFEHAPIRLSRWLLCLVLSGFAVAAAAVETIPLYTYYVDPPFAANSEYSLTDKLARWLTRRSGGRFVFEPTQIPRRRLNVMLEKERWSGVVAWANPQWFGDVTKPCCIWSHAIMFDANLVISPKTRPIDFQDDHSLEGLTLGGVLGYRYPDLEKLIKSKKLFRADVSGEFQNLQKLKAQRVDITFLQASSLPYFLRIFPDFDQWAFVSKKPRTIFNRYLFTSPFRPELLAFLNEQLDVLAADKTWEALLGTCNLIQAGKRPQEVITWRLCD